LFGAYLHLEIIDHAIRVGDREILDVVKFLGCVVREFDLDVFHLFDIDRFDDSIGL
jgi:hypothetical protein